ncbi:MAG: nucleotidyltransferase substrate binding protein [Pseudomonadota bacterium]
MGSKKTSPLDKAVLHLVDALAIYDKNASDELAFLTVSKAFEVLVEYGWRELKRRVEDEGLEVQSPKEAIREAARLKIISDPEKWIKAVENRNASVHDYFGIGEESFIKIVRGFLKLAKMII